MISRRHALAGAAASTFMPLRLMAGRGRGPATGIQLFMFLDDARKDLTGTLRRIARLGYHEVELLTGLADGMTMRRALAASGLRARSIHAPAAPYFPGAISLSTDLDRVISDARTAGLRYVICASPHLPPERLASTAPQDLGHVMASLTSADWKGHAEFLNRVAIPLQQAGLRLAHHNHVSEFVGVPGQRGIDILLAQTDRRTVWFELDCGWALAAGADPTKVIRDQGQRIRLLHLKDVTGPTGEGTRTVTLGQGIGDWRSIMAAATVARIEGAYVEQEQPIADLAGAARANIIYLQSIERRPS